MGFAARAIFQDETKHKTQLSSKSLKKMCIERIANLAVPKKHPRGDTVSDECFNCEYTNFFYVMFENSKQEHSQL